MKQMNRLGAIALPLSVAVTACAGWDNPVALSELQPDVEFEIGAAELETFEEVEIHVHVKEGGAPLRMQQSQLEIQHSAGGPVQTVDLEPKAAGYAAHVTFFQPGDHHIHFMGMPEGHHLMIEMGEHEVAVQRQHQVIGPYRVELEVSPAPVMEGGSAHIHLLAFDLLADGTPGNPAGGLQIGVEIHDPGGAQAQVAMTEEGVGEYEVQFVFGAPGTYELHVAIEVGVVQEHGEFHLPVLSESGEEDGGGHEEGGHTHG